jgi:hypothetical protein
VFFYKTSVLFPSMKLLLFHFMKLLYISFYEPFIAPNHIGLKIKLWLVFGWYSVQMSARTLAILFKDFCGFPQSLKANVGMVP